MSINGVLKEVNFSPSKEEFLGLKKESEEIIEKLESEIKKERVDADVFLGGSLAKGTIVKKNGYDIDIFVRFDLRIDNISNLLEKIVRRTFGKSKFIIEKLHGSRDYFQIRRDKRVIFEIIPVNRIKHPREARNVTDLSYFHVNYVKNRIRGTKMGREITLTKAFLKSAGAYGAESYISGFSGYAVECLIINYKTLENMLKELAKSKERIILDPEKRYKNKSEVAFGLNESKMQSPIVLVDPTWKERNVVAALSRETFEKFLEITRKFIKSPSIKFFEDKVIDASKLKEEAKSKKAEFIEVILETERQAGDIAGTKMKKFARFIVGETKKYFDVLKEEFEYNDEQTAKIYLIVKSKKEIIRIGPPVNLEKAVKEFKKRNKNTFVKNGVVHARIKINFSAKKFIEDYTKKEKERVNEMGISELKVR